MPDQPAPTATPAAGYAPPPGHQRLQLQASWDGAGFVGWQAQAAGRSVQDTLQAALGGIVTAALRPVAAGRTDAGVHALAMPLHWDVAGLRVSPERLLRALNARLPPDLAVSLCQPAPPNFHARFCCTERRYLYRLRPAPVRAPLLASRVLHLPAVLNLGAMQAAAALLVGEHDFAAFATREERQTRRRLHRLEVMPAGDELHLHVWGESFLRHMVRALVGTLVQVGRGELAAGEVASVLASGKRAQAGPNVPPHGLYFAGARYPAHLSLPGVDNPAPR